MYTCIHRYLYLNEGNLIYLDNCPLSPFLKWLISSCWNNFVFLQLLSLFYLTTPAPAPPPLQLGRLQKIPAPGIPIIANHIHHSLGAYKVPGTTLSLLYTQCYLLVTILWGRHPLFVLKNHEVGGIQKGYPCDLWRPCAPFPKYHVLRRLEATRGGSSVAAVLGRLPTPSVLCGSTEMKRIL